MTRVLNSLVKTGLDYYYCMCVNYLIAMEYVSTNYVKVNFTAIMAMLDNCNMVMMLSYHSVE